MSRPHIICHMASSIDGRIIAEEWGNKLKLYGALYERCHASFESQAWMVGRVTMEEDFTEGRKPKLPRRARRIARKPFIGNKDATSFAVAVDAQGKLGWDQNEIDGDHIIAILSESVSNGYLQYLQDKQVSYIFAGKKRLDFEVAMDQLFNLFNVRTLMLEGGGNINGSMLNAGLIDEISLLILPIADGTPGNATTFEVSDYLPKKPARQLRLFDFEKLEHDVLWLRYNTGEQ